MIPKLLLQNRPHRLLLNQDMLQRIFQIVAICVIFSNHIIACAGASGADIDRLKRSTHNAREKPSQAPADDFPLTNLRLATRPVSRWACGIEALDRYTVVHKTDEYLAQIEQHLSDLDKSSALNVADDKRFAKALQYFIQVLKSEKQTAAALKLEHRLARIQAKHPEFKDYL